jgi:hypothetical protein
MQSHMIYRKKCQYVVYYVSYMLMLPIYWLYYNNEVSFALGCLLRVAVGNASLTLEVQATDILRLQIVPLFN